ncbi:hypothetical protein HELRODRAFT_159010 [Helobdella robusta]|uniref:WH2 domain-containing protein n=1 Tax=Helobdella robusta TaxID=6412 RepID=T1ENH3_HELRO|nr:hypothetical protein HELRODRAFT_159010 [Helobdella robusta]ESO12473.1 hypothetical protein HELRODRAFT_159010 [Helobdella robusta]
MVDTQKFIYSKDEVSNSNLLEDIHRGIRLKPTQHLMNDKSGPLLKNDGPKTTGIQNLPRKNCSTSFTRSGFNDFHNPETGKNSVFNKGSRQVVTSSKRVHENISHALTNPNKQNQIKPPILAPKPKMVLDSNFENSEFKMDISGPANVIIRKCSVDLPSSIPENFSKIKLNTSAHLPKSNSTSAFVDKNCQSRDNDSNSIFKRNRSIVSSLLENNLMLPNLFNDSKDIKQSVCIERRNSESAPVIPKKQFNVSSSNLEVVKSGFQNQETNDYHRKQIKRIISSSPGCSDKTINMSDRCNSVFNLESSCNSLKSKKSPVNCSHKSGDNSLYNISQETNFKDYSHGKN